MHTSKVSKITVITDLQIDSKGDELLVKHKNVKTVACSCGSTTKKARQSQQKYSCDQEFDKDGDIVWATLFRNVRKEGFPVHNPTRDKIQAFLLETKTYKRS